MQPSKKRIKDHSKYDRALKREVARRYLAGEYSYRVAAEEYDLPNGDTVKEFVRWYKRQLTAEADHLAGSHPEMSLADESAAAVEGSKDQAQKIKELKEQLRLAELKAEAWRTLVDNAGNHIGVDLVKKFGPKPSSK